MRLLDITASAHPDGNRIDLSWTNPAPAQMPGVRVVRREGTHPRTIDDGVVVAHGTGLLSASDDGLVGERVYYYTLFPFHGDPPDYQPDPHNRTSAMATSPYEFAGLIYRLLPAIYQRYDHETGVLRRFLELPGGELDRLYSFARAALMLTDIDRVDGRLLPLLAQWIGWRTDHSLPVGAQRNEIRYAPRIYQTIGATPTLDATVARVTGWANRTKEFVHNVARSNQPERLNLWSMLRTPAGALGRPALASLNFTHDGRPVAVREADGSITFFYHTHRLHGWDIWAKRFDGDQWRPSMPVVDRPGVDKYPSAAMQGNRLWLFWQHCDPGSPPGQPNWRISFITRSGDTWSAPQLFGDPATPRRMPVTVADNTGGLWLFWLEYTGGAWQLRYNRHNGTQWQLSVPATMPPDGTAAPRVEDDLFVLFHPTSTSQRLWLLWARHQAGADGQSRWSIVYRIKQGLDPAATDWSAIRALPKAGTGGYHDREPAALLTTGGNLEVLWSTTQHGGWALSRNVLSIGTFTWGTSQRVGSGPYSWRAPLAVDTGQGTLIAFRSNESIAYGSADFGATATLDHRYAGTTTVDTGAAAKLALRGGFEDFLTYTYDTGTGGVRTNNDRIARDTVGLYLTPTTADPDEIEAVISRLAGLLAEFTPVTARAVVITP